MFERGYHGTSLRDVSAMAGIQMSSLYYHFPSKQALLVDIMDATIRDLVDQVTSVMVEDLPPADRLVAGISQHVRFHAERRMESFIADSELRALEPENRQLIVGMRDDYTAAFRRALEQGAELGQFAFQDVSVVLSALFSMINTVPTWYRPEGRMTLDMIGQEIGSIFLRGVSTRVQP